MATIRVRSVTLAVASLVFAVASACASGASSGPARGGEGDLPTTAAATAAPAASTGADTSGSGSRAADGSGNPGAPVPAAGSLIVRTGTMEAEVTDVAATIDSARVAVVGLGGYVAGSDESNTNDKRAAAITYRIPATRWDDAIVALRGLASKLVTEHTEASEVTAQVVDLGARIANLRSSESALQAIMTRAQKIPDVLAVQQQLSDVRDQIERLTAQRDDLQKRAALATLTVTWEAPPVAVTQTTARGWSLESEVDRTAGQALQLAQGLATAGLWLLFVGLPALLLTLLLVVIAVLAYRWIARRVPPMSVRRP